MHNGNEQDILTLLNPSTETLIVPINPVFPFQFTNPFNDINLQPIYWSTNNNINNNNNSGSQQNITNYTPSFQSRPRLSLSNLNHQDNIDFLNQKSNKPRYHPYYNSSERSSLVPNYHHHRTSLPNIYSSINNNNNYKTSEKSLMPTHIETQLDIFGSSLDMNSVLRVTNTPSRSNERNQLSTVSSPSTVSSSSTIITPTKNLNDLFIKEEEGEKEKEKEKEKKEDNIILLMNNNQNENLKMIDEINNNNEINLKNNNSNQHDTVFDYSLLNSSVINQLPPPPSSQFIPQPQPQPQSQQDISAIPRKQNLRYEKDAYTPRWVRYTGQLKQGYCDSCRPNGRWLQLKNSAYWYHKQFFHGISSVSGQPFAAPLEKRINQDTDVLEGLCHQCLQYVPICNSKRKNSVLWYRHAHKCHIYNKPTKQK
ncbi:unnamed protein product [Cunninghamella echinulata]